MSELEARFEDPDEPEKLRPAPQVVRDIEVRPFQSLRRMMLWARNWPSLSCVMCFWLPPFSHY